jgi:protein-tyrosine phosphatase
VLAGAPNFREMSGSRTHDGYVVRRGRLYRSEALHRVTDEDLVRMREIALDVVYDLRTPSERERQENRWPANGVPEVRSANPDHAALGSLMEQMQVAIEGSPAEVRLLMLSTYRALPEAFASVLASAVDDVVEGRTPVLVHCAAGKDRTGYVAAALQLALGVPYRDVKRDYLLSNDLYGTPRLAAAIERTFGVEPHPETVDALAVHEEYLQAALRAIEDDHGSFRGYLRGAVGVDAERERAFKRELLTD